MTFLSFNFFFIISEPQLRSLNSVVLRRVNERTFAAGDDDDAAAAAADALGAACHFLLSMHPTDIFVSFSYGDFRSLLIFYQAISNF